MPNFSFTYYMDSNADFDGRDDGNKRRDAFEAWFKGLEAVVVAPNTPFGPAKTVNTNGVADNTRADRLTGFCIVEAANMDAAVALVKGCPFLEIGSVDVAEVFRM